MVDHQGVGGESRMGRDPGDAVLGAGISREALAGALANGSTTATADGRVIEEAGAIGGSVGAIGEADAPSAAPTRPAVMSSAFSKPPIPPTLPPLSIRTSKDQIDKQGKQRLEVSADRAETSPAASNSVPVYVMLPLDTVNAEGVFKYKSSPWFLQTLQELINSGIHGVAVDVWWGAVEKKPRLYDFSGYEELFELLILLGLKIQVVLAFHACGGNVGDTAVVPLPSWVLACGERDPDIFYTDRPRQQSPGNRNPECISLFADEEGGVLRGRSPLQCYVDFMKAFRDAFLLKGEIFVDAISEVVLGTGPCGELRYPSYAETNGWRFPGIGEFQCYDRRALASLASAAEDVGRPEWGHAGPHDVGDYNSTPDETGFFRSWDGAWDTAYGRFFLGWYSQALLDHGDRMLQAAASVFNVLDLKTPRAEGGGGGGGGGGGVCRSPSAHKSIGDGMQQPAIVSPNSVTSEQSTHSEPMPSDTNQQSMSLSCHDSEPADAMDLSQHGGTAMHGSGDHTLEWQGARGFSSGPSTGFAKSRGPSYASFKSSASVSDGLNCMEEWVWPTPSGKRVNINLKIAGVHWWYHTKSRPAELTAGYMGYEGIISLCAKYGVGLTLTCVEMCDAQHPPAALCGPEGLLLEVKEVACRLGVPLAGENALPCFMPNAVDESALQRIVYNTQPHALDVDPADAEMMIFNANSGQSDKSDGYLRSRRTPSLASSSGSLDEKAENGDRLENGTGSPRGGNLLPPMRSFTFLRLTPEMTSSETYQKQWNRFMKLMRKNALRFKTSQRWRRDLGFHHEDYEEAF